MKRPLRRCPCTARGSERRVGQRCAELRVRSHATDDRKPRESGHLGRFAKTLHESTHDRALVRRREVGPAGLGVDRAEIAHGIEQRGLQPGEREVETGHARNREVERGRVPVLREPVDRRTARIAEPEESSSLVERLARCVVESRAEPLGAAALVHGEEQRVPPAREQARERRLDGRGLEVERRDVPLEVIHRDERQPSGPREGLGGRDADEERADQPGALGDRDSLDLVERSLGFSKCVPHDG